MQRGHTVFFENRPKIVAAATVAGPKECEGIVGEYVDLPLSDDMFGESTFERAERKMFLAAVERSIEKAGITQHEVDAILAGDLLNQIISTFLRRSGSTATRWSWEPPARRSRSGR